MPSRSRTSLNFAAGFPRKAEARARKHLRAIGIAVWSRLRLTDGLDTARRMAQEAVTPEEHLGRDAPRKTEVETWPSPRIE